MKIDSSVKPAGSTNISEARSRAPAKAAGGAQAIAVPEVKLSGLSSQMHVSGDSPSFDAARVSEIKQAISEGRFTINAGAIADRLIGSAMELIQSQRRA